MTMSDKEKDLDLLFAEARRGRDDMPERLTAGILADAELVRLERQRRQSHAPAGWVRRLVDGLGGWQAVGGLAAASVVGLWVGFSAPSFLPDPASYFVAPDASFIVADLGLEAEYLEEVE